MAPIPGYKASVYVTGSPSVPFTNTVLTNAGGNTAYYIASTNQRYLDPTQPITVQVAPDGVTWGTVTSGFIIQACGGIVTFAIALTGSAPAVRISGSYLPVSQAVQAKSIDIQNTVDILDATTFASGGWKVKIAALASATYKLSQWQVDGFYLAALGGLLLVSAYSGANANARIEGYAYIKTDAVKIAPNALNEESIDFEAYGPSYAILL